MANFGQRISTVEDIHTLTSSRGLVVSRPGLSTFNEMNNGKRVCGNQSSMTNAGKKMKQGDRKSGSRIDRIPDRVLCKFRLPQ
jgi:hypothetical protein